MLYPFLNELLVKEKLASLEVSVIKVPGRGALETIVVKHKSQNKKLPSIMMVHGGPHGSLTVAINNAWVAYALDGCKLFPFWIAF